MKVEAQTDGVMKVSDVVVPVMFVDTSPPTHGISDGPQARPLAIDTSDQLGVKEASGTNIAQHTSRTVSQLMALQPTVEPKNISDSATVTINRQPLEGFATMAMAGGVIADQVLVPARAGYRGVVQPYAVQSPSAAIVPLITIFQDEDNAGLGGQNGVIHTTLLQYFLCAFGQTTSNDNVPLRPITMYGTVANKDVEVDLSGGAGAEQVNMWYLYWWIV